MSSSLLNVSLVTALHVYCIEPNLRTHASSASHIVVFRVSAAEDKTQTMTYHHAGARGCNASVDSQLGILFLLGKISHLKIPTYNEWRRRYCFLCGSIFHSNLYSQTPVGLI